MKCVIITYKTGGIEVYQKDDPQLLDELIEYHDCIDEIQIADFIKPKPMIKLQVQK